MIVLEGRLLNPASEDVFARGRVVIDGSRIVDAGRCSEVDVPENARVYDVGGTIMPGLIDAHVHYTGFRSGDYIKEALLTPFGVFVARAIRDLRATLEAGYTTVCDAGSVVALHLRDAVEERTVDGPRIVAAGYPLSQTFGHGDLHFLPVELVDPRTSPLMLPFQSLLCDGEDEFRKGAKYVLRTGSDFVKIFVTGGVASQRDKPEYPQMTRREIEAVVEEARRAGRVCSRARGVFGGIHQRRRGWSQGARSRDDAERRRDKCIA